jgi:hypothetical protein
MFFRPPVMPRPTMRGLRGIGDALMQAGDLPDQLLWMYLTGQNPQSLGDLQNTLPMMGGVRGGRVSADDPLVAALRKSGLDDTSFDQPMWSGVRVPRQLIPNRTVFGTPISNFRNAPERDAVMEPGHQFMGVMRDIAQDPMRYRMAEASDDVYTNYIGRKAGEFQSRKQKVVDSLWAAERRHHERGIQAPKQADADLKGGLIRQVFHTNKPHQRPGGLDGSRDDWQGEWYNMSVQLPQEARRRNRVRRRQDLGKPRGG